MSIAPLLRLIGAYHGSWLATGPAGRQFLAGALIYATHLGGVSFALPLFLQARGYNGSEIGQILAASAITLLVFGFPIARLSSKGFQRHLLALGPIAAAAGLVVMVVAPPGALWLVTGGSFLSSFGSAAFWTLGDPLLAATTPSHHRTNVFALKFLAWVVGFALGGVLGGWIPSLLEPSARHVGAGSYGVVLLLMALLDLVQSLIFWQLPAVALAAPERRAGSTPVLLFLALVVPEIGFATGFGAIKPYLSLFLTGEVGLSTESASTALAAAAITGGVGVLAMPLISARVGLLPVIAICRLAGAVVVASWFADFGPFGVASLICVYWLFMDGTEALYIAAAMERVAPGSRAALAATYAMLWSVGSTFGNYTSGVLQDTASGFAAAFAVGIGGYLVAGLWTAIVFPRLPRIGLDQAAAQPSPGSPAPEIAVRPEPG